MTDDGRTDLNMRDAWLKTGALSRLLAVLDRDGEEARVVGGAVRNVLLGMPIAEVDVATTALPEEVVKPKRAAKPRVPKASSASPRPASSRCRPALNMAPSRLSSTSSRSK